ncbi:hypothetical protein TcCL_Unassigned03787, partial [Trypanosoma cruzi]
WWMWSSPWAVCRLRLVFVTRRRFLSVMWISVLTNATLLRYGGCMTGGMTVSKRETLWVTQCLVLGHRRSCLFYGHRRSCLFYGDTRSCHAPRRKRSPRQKCLLYVGIILGQPSVW